MERILEDSMGRSVQSVPKVRYVAGKQALDYCLPMLEDLIIEDMDNFNASLAKLAIPCDMLETPDVARSINLHSD